MCIWGLKEQTGAERAGRITAFRVWASQHSLAASPSHPPPQDHQARSTHTLCHPPWPWQRRGPPELFFYMDAPKAGALPNTYFPGKHRTRFCFWGTARVLCQWALCQDGSYSSCYSFRKLHHQAVCPLMKLPSVDGRARKGSEQAIYSMFKWIYIKFRIGIVIFFFFGVETILWVDTRKKKCDRVTSFFYLLFLLLCTVLMSSLKNVLLSK